MSPGEKLVWAAAFVRTKNSVYAVADAQHAVKGMHDTRERFLQAQRDGRCIFSEDEDRECLKLLEEMLADDMPASPHR